MRDWIKLFENDSENDNVSDDEHADKFDRERRVEQEVRSQCERIGLSFYDQSHPVIYDEDEGSITIRPDDEEIEMRQLSYLQKYGSNIRVLAGVEYFSIVITGLKIR